VPFEKPLRQHRCKLLILKRQNLVIRGSEYICILNVARRPLDRRVSSASVNWRPLPNLFHLIFRPCAHQASDTDVPDPNLRTYPA
jgi:hypothetical protein